MTTATVSIVGAGLGGLTLARALQVRGVRAVVYDLEAGPHARSQGAPWTCIPSPASVRWSWPD
jgi:flavin-dependent dehydrogenase